MKVHVAQFIMVFSLFFHNCCVLCAIWVTIFFFVFVCYKRINGTLHHVFCEHWHYVKLSKTVIGWNGPWAFSTFNNVLMCGNIYFNVSACVITHLQSSWWRAKCQLSVFFWVTVLFDFWNLHVYTSFGLTWNQHKGVLFSIHWLRYLTCSTPSIMEFLNLRNLLELFLCSIRMHQLMTKLIVSLDASLYLSIYVSLVMPHKWPSIKLSFSIW